MMDKDGKIKPAGMEGQSFSLGKFLNHVRLECNRPTWDLKQRVTKIEV
jgi:hypothetical protein